MILEWIWIKLEAIICTTRKWAESLCGSIWCLEYIHSRWCLGQTETRQVSLLPLCFSLRTIKETDSPVSRNCWSCSCLQIELLQLGSIPVSLTLDWTFHWGTEPLTYVALGPETLRHFYSMWLDSFSSTECIWLLAVMRTESLKLYHCLVFFGLDPYVYMTGTWALHFSLSLLVLLLFPVCVPSVIQGAYVWYFCITWD